MDLFPIIENVASETNIETEFKVREVNSTSKKRSKVQINQYQLLEAILKTTQCNSISLLECLPTAKRVCQTNNNILIIKIKLNQNKQSILTFFPAEKVFSKDTMSFGKEPKKCAYVFHLFECS